MRTLKRMAVSAVILSVFVPATGYSQAPRSSEPATPPAAPKVETTVVVTATRSESDVARTPISASVITPEEIAARPVQSLDQQLTLTEGVYVQRNQGFSATDSHVAIRGFNTTSRTLVLVDGQPFNDAYAGSVNWTGLPSGQVDRIEVVRGPFSSLYGGNALGGVINIRTRPITGRAFDGSAEIGSFGSHRVGGFFSERFGGRLGVSAGFEHFATDGYNSRRFTATPGNGNGTPVTGPIPTQTTAGASAAIIGEGGKNALNRVAARFKADYQMSAATVLSLQYLRTDYEYEYNGYRSYLRDATGATIDSGAVVYDHGGTARRLSVTPNSFLQGPGEQHSNFFSGTFEHAFPSGAGLHVDAGVYVIPTFQFRTLAGGNTSTSGPGTLTDGNRRTTHANVHYTRTVQEHQLTIGGETRHETAENNQFPLTNWTDTGTQGNQSYLAAGSSINQSAYLQDQIALADNLRLVVGLRYDYWHAYDGVSDGFSSLAPLTPYAAQTKNQVSGKAALGYTLPGDWNLRVSAGNAFRNPNVFDLYATSVSGSGTTFAANPSLVPETVKSWEAGVRHRFRTGTSVDAAYYENRIQDLIYRQADFDVDPSGNYRINVNAGAGRTRGVELGVRQTLAAGFEFRTTYSYTDAIITSNPGNPAIVGKRVTFIPDHMASAQLLGRYGRWNGSLAGHYTGRLFSTDTNTDTTKGVPGSYSPFFTMDASVSYQLTSRVQPFVTSENLLDRRYYVFYLSPGRTVFGGVRVRL